MINTVDYFTADFWQDKVYVAGKAFPTGYFITHLMNQYYVNDTAARIAVYPADNYFIEKFLDAGYVDDYQIREERRALPYLLRTLATLQPFDLLNTEWETKRVTELFSDKNLSAAADYFKMKHSAISYHPGEPAVYIGFGDREKQFKAGETLVKEMIRTLQFYESLGEDMSCVYEKTKKFVSRLNELKRLDESHLSLLAREVFGSFSTPADIEYVPILKSPEGKTYVVAKRMRFSRYLSFLLADFYEGLHNGHFPQKCGICKRYFLMQSARKQRYCDGIDPNDPRKRPCRKVAAEISREAREKYEDHPIKQICAKRLNTINKHLHQKKISEEYAKAAKQLAQNRCSDAIHDPEYYTSGEYERDMSQEAIYNEIDKYFS